MRAAMHLMVLVSIAAVSASAIAGPQDNKAIAIRYYETIFKQGKVDEAIDRYVAPDYVQHSPNVPPGREGLRNGLKGVIARRNERSRMDIVRAAAEGDQVVLFVHNYEEGQRGIVIIEWFRIVDGRIVEHWDVMQAVPEKSNSNSSMY